MEKPIIAVVGSLNVDYTYRVPRIPIPGETLTASESFTCFGGKGANQAIAAARAGGSVRMIGCVGNDDSADRYRKHLSDEGINIEGIIPTDSAPTGSAFITVDDAGENAIVVDPGANHALRPEQIEQLAKLLESADALLLQLECPIPVVRRAAEIARSAGVRVFLNPSPWDDAIRKPCPPIDVLIANETEAGQLTGKAFTSLDAHPDQQVNHTLIVTRGAESTLVFEANGEHFESTPPRVTPVDTVGAGDTFAGALSVAIAEQMELSAAVSFANQAAALATQKAGAQTTIPCRQDIVNALG